tara:strand:+ start:263 stop:1729 length:1467 start_codon:yes stop_codon:yes gene_type:complete
VDSTNIGKSIVSIGLAIFAIKFIFKSNNESYSIPEHMIPLDVIKIMDTFESQGYEVLIVGGAVRDALLGETPKDYDLATDAMPEDVENIIRPLKGFEYVNTPKGNIARGALTSLVLAPDGELIEITTYRAELGYEDGNRAKPIAIPAKSFIEDAQRRDFTINAIAMDKYGKIIDPMNGLADLKKGIIRAVGNPTERFTEDPLRMIRAIRFATRLNFQLENHTSRAILDNVSRTTLLSNQRLREEIGKVLTQPDGFKMLMEYNIIPTLMPEMVDLKQYMHSLEYHPEGSLYNHYIKAFETFNENPNRTEMGAWALLFHDIAKPATAKWNGSFHTFLRHDVIGEKIILENYNYQNSPFQFTKKELNAMAWVTKNHLSPFWNMTKKSKVAKLANDVNFSLLVEVAKADSMDLNSELFQSRLEYFDEVKEEIQSRKSKAGSKPKDFAMRVFKELNIPPSIERNNIMLQIDEMISSGEAHSHDNALDILKERL